MAYIAWPFWPSISSGSWTEQVVGSTAVLTAAEGVELRKPYIRQPLTNFRDMTFEFADYPPDFDLLRWQQLPAAQLVLCPRFTDASMLTREAVAGTTTLELEGSTALIEPGIAVISDRWRAVAVSIVSSGAGVIKLSEPLPASFEAGSYVANAFTAYAEIATREAAPNYSSLKVSFYESKQ